MKGVLGSVKKSLLPEELKGKPLDHWKDVSFLPDDDNVAAEGGNGGKINDSRTTNDDDDDDEETFWKNTLSEKEYDVLRNKGTEAPNSSRYNKHLPRNGHYACRACGNPLYSYRHKFESGCGWPAFGNFVAGSVDTRDDFTMGMKRTEIICHRCQSHLGHVFAEYNNNEYDTFTERHCVNGISIRYVDEPL